MPRFNSNIFYCNSPKIKFFCKKMQNFLALGAALPDPRTSGGWGLCSQTPNLWRLGASPPDPHWPLAAEGPPPRPQNSPPLQISGYAPGYILLHHFNVLGYSSTSITIYCDVRTFLLLPIFCCYFLLIYLFVTTKAATASCSEEASRFGRRNVKPINKLIGSTKWL